MALDERLVAFKDKIIDLVKEGKDMFETMNEFSEWNSLVEVMANVSTLNDFVMNLIGATEVAAEELASTIEGFKSEDKVAAAAAALDEMIDLPWWLDKIDGPIFEMLISLGVDLLNKQYPDGWDMDVVRESVKDGKNLVVSLKEKVVSGA